MQVHVGRVLVRVDVDAGRLDLGRCVAAIAREPADVALELLVGAMAEGVADRETRHLEQRPEPRVVHRLAREPKVEVTHAHRVAGHDVDSGLPAVLAVLELGRELGLVVAERLERLANLPGRVLIGTLEAPFGRIARLAGEADVRADVVRDHRADADDLELGAGRGRAGQQQAQRSERARCRTGFCS